MEQLEELKEKDTPLVVKFEGDWCQPCKQYTPIFEEVTSQLGDDVNTLVIDVDEHIDLSKSYKVLSVPMTLVFKNGEIKEREMGVLQKQKLMEIITNHV